MRLGKLLGVASLVAVYLSLPSAAYAVAGCIANQERIEDATVVAVSIPDGAAPKVGTLTVDGVIKGSGDPVSNFAVGIDDLTDLRFSDGVAIADLNGFAVADGVSDIRYCPLDSSPPPAVRVTKAATSTATAADILSLDLDLVAPATDIPGVFRVYGAAASDWLGGFGDNGVAYGDVDGDGYDDMIMGAWRVNGLSGEVYVIYGSEIVPASTITLPPVGDIPLGGTRIIAEEAATEEDEFLGRAVAVADINGDGFDDMIIGKRGTLFRGTSTAGEVVIVYGSDTMPALVDLASPTPVSTTLIRGDIDSENAGVSVASGDMNADGYADVIIGAPGDLPSGLHRGGKVYVIYGNPLLPDTEINLNTDSEETISPFGETRIFGDRDDDRTGNSVASGDVDGDGYDDVIIGSKYADALSTFNRGAVYVIYGGTGLPNSIVDLNSPNNDLCATDLSAAPRQMRIFGRVSNSWLGTSVAAGDVNGDGFDDVIASATGITGVGDNFAVGEVYVIYGEAVPPVNPVCLWDGIGAHGETTITGTEEFVHLGFSLSSADTNGDGFDDLILGAPESVRPGPLAEDTFLDETGTVYLFDSGPALEGQHLIDPREVANLAVVGDDLDDRWGHAAEAGGDLDRDGVPEWAASAYSGDNPTGDFSAGYVATIFGATSAVSATRIEHSIAGDAPPTDFGPVVRTVLDYLGGSASKSTVTLFRGAPVNPPAGTVLPVHWQVSSDRGASYDVTFQYTDAECGACTEPLLEVFSSTDDGSSWGSLAGTLNADRNEITVSGTSLSALFALVVPSGEPPPASADLALTMSDDPDPVIMGDVLTYRLIATNNGPDPATGVSVTDTLPLDLTFVSATTTAPGDFCVETGRMITCTLNEIANGGAAKSMTIVVTADTAGPVINSATATAAEADPVPGNDTATQNTTVNDPAPPPEEFAITRVEYRVRQDSWRIEGTTTASPDITLSLYLEHLEDDGTITEMEIGTLNADTRGKWRFRGGSSSANPPVSADFVTVGNDGGGARSDAASINIK